MSRIPTIIGALLLMCAVASTASAQQQVRKKFKKDRIHVLQPKPVLQKKRFELVPRFGLTFNDSVNRNFKVGVNANFHIAEPFYVGGIFEWYNLGTLGGATNTFKEATSRTGTNVDSAVINYYGGLELGFVPVWGKFSLVNNWVVFYDIAVTAGGLFINAQSLQLPTEKSTGGGTISIAGRMFLNKWIAFNVELRDVLFLADISSGGETVSSFTNVASIGFGFSFYLPTGFEYTERVIEVRSQ